MVEARADFSRFVEVLVCLGGGGMLRGRSRWNGVRSHGRESVEAAFLPVDGGLTGETFVFKRRSWAVQLSPVVSCFIEYFILFFLFFFVYFSPLFSTRGLGGRRGGDDAQVAFLAACASGLSRHG